MEHLEITRRREALGLSCAGLAREIGVPTSTVWRWEAGKFRPSRWLVPAILAALEQLEQDARTKRQEQTA